MNKPVKLRYVNQLVGSLLLAVAVMLFLVVMLVLRQQGWFVTTFRLYTHLSEHQLDGLHRGTEVMLLGHQVGQVERISYAGSTEAGKHDEIQIVLQLRSQPEWPIYSGSVAYVQRHLAGAGEAYLEIRRAAPNDKLLKDGDTIEIATEAAPSDKLDLVVSSMQEIRGDFGKVRDSMVPAFEKMQDSLSRLDETNRRMQGVVDDMQKTSPKLSPIADQMQAVLDQSKEVTETLRQEVQDVPGTVNELRGGLHTAQEVLDAARSHWLLRRYIDDPSEDRTIEPAEVHRGEIWP